MTKHVLLLSCALGALTISAGGAYAATATATATDTAPASAADTGAGNSIGELVVTAERRQTALQEIPVAVSVFTGAERDLIGINSVQDVTNFAPGFTYDPGTVHAYIRGVGRQSVNVTDDQRVSTYEDEFVVYSPYGLDKSSLFLSQEQIERGPQNVGGRAAAAGSIDMISVRPTDHPYAELRATVANYGTYNIEGAISGQIAPGLDVRLAAYDHNQNSGFYKNLTGLPSEGNEIHEWYVEGQVDYKPNDKFEFWARGFLSGWHNRGDAGSRDGFVNGSYDETVLTDSNAYVGGGLFVNPNFGFAAPNGNPTANAALLAAKALGDPDPTPLSVTLFNPGVLNNPSAINSSTFAAPISRDVTLRNYDNFNYALTYNFDNNVEMKYTGGVQGYQYTLNYSGTDTNVKSFTLPGSNFSGATIGALNNISALLANFGLLPPGSTGPFPGCAAGSLLCTGVPGSGALPAAQALPAGSLLVINPLINANYVENDWWTAHDISFQSTGNSRFQWVVGGFYYYQHYDQPYEVSDPLQPQLVNPDYVPPGAIVDPLFFGAVVGLSAGVPAPANPRHDILYLDYNFNVRNYSSYAQASYALNDQFKITGNIRYSNDHKWGLETARYLYFGSNVIDGFGGLLGANTPALDITPSQTCLTGNNSTATSCNTSTTLGKGVTSAGVISKTDGYARRMLGDTSSAITGGAGLEWKPTSDIFVYARYGRGYESMSFNAGQILPNPEVAPEFLNSYEVGYKQSIGHDFAIDIAAFYYDYNKLQLPISINNGGVTQSQFINVPKAVSDGIEVEANWSPIKDLVFVLSYSYDHTSITTGCTGTVTAGVLKPAPGALCILDTNDPGAVEPGANPFPGQAAGSRNQGVNGNPLPDAPLHKIALTMAYTWRFEPGSLTVDGSYIYRSKTDGTVFNRFYDDAPSWNDVDLRATWKGSNDRYEVIGYLKNVFNTLQYTVANGGAGLAGSATAVGLNEVNIFSLAPPRTYGVEIRYKFF